MKQDIVIPIKDIVKDPDIYPRTHAQGKPLNLLPCAWLNHKDNKVLTWLG